MTLSHFRKICQEQQHLASQIAVPSSLLSWLNFLRNLATTAMQKLATNPRIRCTTLFHTLAQWLRSGYQ